MTDTPVSLTPTQLSAYFAFTEVSSLLRPAVEKQLRDVGALSYVQFQLLARLGDSPDGTLRMTDLADGVVYSRSGLTYQAQLLEQRELITRSPSPDDERSTVAAITGAGREVLQEVFPGHIRVVRELLFASLSEADVDDLARILGKVAGHLRAAPPRSAAPRRRR
ncbi:MarR family winged helix-turn-helix transcriptional regulator [Nesterenkonia haasae]|uniref:MarR family winged helix-turn-helix transcriptional regulator n=1 Tax=Nesterenkonia haasae TaxID=2587813 RepID=UPI001391C6D2|nr:MarR family transcriptional regulator [Nesterenkonia haasae]NDK31811.1 MarR family transcriptional regulator [Nesterenkonia haasae]